MGPMATTEYRNVHRNISLPYYGLLLTLLLTCATAMALDEVRIGELSYLDKQYMQQQRDSLEELSRRHLGRQFNGNRDNDLELLQRLLDQGLVKNSQTEALQAMGIVMGDLLAQDLGLDWVVYEDKKGRSRALRYKQTDKFLFPVTMIARRREADNREPVEEIYQRAAQSMRAAIPPLPFQ